jgi:hypothetical protein
VIEIFTLELVGEASPSWAINTVLEEFFAFYNMTLTTHKSSDDVVAEAPEKGEVDQQAEA